MPIWLADAQLVVCSCTDSHGALDALKAILLLLSVERMYALSGTHRSVHLMNMPATKKYSHALRPCCSVSQCQSATITLCAESPTSTKDTTAHCMLSVSDSSRLHHISRMQLINIALLCKMVLFCCLFAPRNVNQHFALRALSACIQSTALLCRVVLQVFLGPIRMDTWHAVCLPAPKL